MDGKAWYLGPLGDLRPLICPAEGVERTVTRYGGVHKAISGARTVDVTGHKATYQLTLPWVTAADVRFVEALYYRSIPGPVRLIDPLATNRLSRLAARLDPADVNPTAGGLLRTSGAPAEIGVPVTRLEWSDVSAGHALAIGDGLPVLASETVTFSLWASSSVASDLDLVLTAIDASGATVATPTHVESLTATWARIRLTATLPAAAVAVRPSVATSGGAIVSLAAAQVEHGNQASPWDLGGAAPTVIVDQAERVSPNYPRNDLSVTLLEA